MSISPPGIDVVLTTQIHWEVTWYTELERTRKENHDLNVSKEKRGTCK